MVKVSSKYNILFKYQDFLIFIGLLLWFSILNIAGIKADIWLNFFLTVLHLGICLLPVLIFSFYKEQFKTSLTRKKYWFYWISCFVILLPLFTIVAVYSALGNLENTDFIYLSGATLALELLLNLNSYYHKKIQHIKWIKKIGLENAVFITIILIAVTISAMATSSLNNPIYHTKERLLVGFEFDFIKILQNFGSFLSFFIQFLLMYLCGYLLFIINSRVLVSKVLKHKGLVIYILSLLTTIAILYPILAQLLISLPLNTIFGRDIFLTNPFDLENAFGAIGIMVISLPFVLALQWGKQNHQILSLEKEKSETELNLLRQQLNPHFFFNTLNNLYALSLQKSDKTSESILQLAELMRYTIYKGQEQSVTIAQELKYIEDYIDLQQIRLKKELDFNFNKEIANESLNIAPLLLIVLIENAFKHGIEPAENAAFLNLSIKFDDESLTFICENSFELENSFNKPGIGLENLKKRLALLYPNQYKLEISDENSIFKVMLNLKLK
jgi:sensor histidine kinase YesM